MNDLTSEQLDGLEYHGASSGTETPAIVRDAILRAVAEIRRHRDAVRADGERVRGVVRHAIHDIGIRQHLGIFLRDDTRCDAVEEISGRVAYAIASPRMPGGLTYAECVVAARNCGGCAAVSCTGTGAEHTCAALAGIPPLTMSAEPATTVVDATPVVDGILVLVTPSDVDVLIRMNRSIRHSGEFSGLLNRLIDQARDRCSLRPVVQVDREQARAMTQEIVLEVLRTTDDDTDGKPLTGEWLIDAIADRVADAFVPSSPASAGMSSAIQERAAEPNASSGATDASPTHACRSPYERMTNCGASTHYCQKPAGHSGCCGDLRSSGEIGIDSDGEYTTDGKRW